MNRLHIALLPLVALCLCANPAWSAPPTVITFEDLPGDQSAIPNGYYGFNWDAIHVLNGSVPPFNNTGYDNGAVSGVNVAFNVSEQPASTLTISGDPFNFIGAYFTGAWNNGLSVTVDGYNNGVLQNTTTFTVNVSAPTFAALNYTNVDELRLQSFGGVHAGSPNGNGTHFVMDDFMYSPIPEPTTLVLCMSGLGLLWRKRALW